ncbi:MAG: hypothetical protein GVY28_02500 [Alphaproteobacteria bacterium]|jgi:hypothetical protein|nr:hypothetical protein [Alphaproteobacteria bacterium]
MIDLLPTVRAGLAAALIATAGAPALAQDVAPAAEAGSPFGIAALDAAGLSGQRGGSETGSGPVPTNGPAPVAGYGANTVGAGTANNASGHLTTIQNAANNAVILSTTNIIVE